MEEYNTSMNNIQTHGLSGTPFYKKYIAIKSRCRDIKSGHPSWDIYGGKGIKNLWDSFEQFRNDMYASYLEHEKLYGRQNTTIERIDSKGHYCKENCKWATKKEQSRNTSRNVFLTHDGQTKTISEWSELRGWPRGILYGRFNFGWSVERALTTPVKKRKARKNPF